MKRCRSTESPQSWPVGGRETLISRTSYKQDVSSATAKTGEKKESLEGIIDKALAASALSASPATSTGRSIKPLPPGLTPLPLPKGVSLLEDGSLLPRSAECHTPLIATSYNTFDEFSSSAVSQQSSQVSSEKESFEKVKAEIDEILSPVSQCGDKAPSHFQPIHGVNHLLSIPPLATAPAAGKPGALPSAPPFVGKGMAMQEILRAMAEPTRRSCNGRKAASSSTQCDICGKTYTESSNLSKHIRTVHLKLRPFRCHLCPSSFAEKNKLGKHIQSVHEHARPYKCELCSATFSQASDRKRHRLVLHEGCRPFVCEHCGKAFGRRSSLTQHCHRVHKTAKPKPVQPPVVLQPPVGGPGSPAVPHNLFVPPHLPMSNPPN